MARKRVWTANVKSRYLADGCWAVVCNSAPGELAGIYGRDGVRLDTVEGAPFPHVFRSGAEAREFLESHFWPERCTCGGEVDRESGDCEKCTRCWDGIGGYVTRFRCAVCGKLTAGRVPRDGRHVGDGTFRFPRRHRAGGEPCPGNIVEAEWVDIGTGRPCSACRGSRNAIPGRKTCHPCLDRANRNTAAREASRLAMGLCAECGLRPPKLGTRRCGDCSEADKQYRSGLLDTGLCTCGRPLADDKPQCEECWARDDVWKKADRAESRRNALLKLARGRAVMCEGWPEKGCCAATNDLQIDHIHDDGYLDLLPSGRRRGGETSVKRVLEDPTPWTWAQLLCMPCNMKKAGAAAKRRYFFCYWGSYSGLISLSLR